MQAQKKQKLYIDALSLAHPYTSGIGHLTLEITRALAADKSFDIWLVAPLGKRKSVLRHGIKNVRVKVFPLPARAMSILTRARLLPPVDLLLGSGVYLFPNYRNWPLAYSKSITYFHDVSFVLYPETVSPRNLHFLVRNYRTWLKRTNKLVTLTNASKLEIIENLQVNSDKISVVPCGVDREVYYRRSSEEIVSTKLACGIDVERYILYVGNIEPRKNIIRLLEAYKMLPYSIRERYALVLVGGGGWLNQDTTALIKELQKEGLNVVQPAGYVEDLHLPALFSGASLLVHPAIYEGFGIPPLQAMACGTPVAASDIPSVVEVTKDSAILFDPYSSQAISHALKTGLTNDETRRMLVQKGRQRASQYSWEKSAAVLKKVILGIAA